ncbi:uncharacterized protein LOC134746928 [Cydia strobilella]|uniref:uncharacterized protein LOC134746928 n=1 Tax=Cydia strobilella TaxID=1100964 RepID=UPI003003A78E
MSAGRFYRHSTLNYLIRRALSTAGLPATLEPSGLSAADGKRPDGCTLVLWSLGRPLAWDATCVDTLAPSHVEGSARKPGTATDQAQTLKRRKYAFLTNEHDFAALAVETLGPWSTYTKKFVKEVGRKFAMLEELRQFGLDRHDFPTLLDNVSTLLRMLTLNIDSRNTKRISFIFYVLMLVSLSCYFYALIISIIRFIFFRDVEEQLLKKSIAFCQLVISTVSLAIFLYMYWNKNKLKRIIDAYILCDSKVEPNSRMSRNMKVTLKSVKKRAFFFWIFVVSEAVVYLMVRPLVVERSSMKDYQLLWGLDPMVETPNFEISVFVITMTVPVIVFVPINTIVLLIVIAGYSEAHMLALSEELLCLWEDAVIDYQMQPPIKESNHIISIDEFVKRRLENIIKSHAQSIHMFQLVEDVFRNGIAIQFILFSIALVSCLMAGLQNTYAQIPFILMIIGMNCFTGQNLMDASCTFEAAVYRCKWEKFDRNNMKSVLLILRIAQKNMKLSARGVVFLTYASFTYIVKSIYSMYTAFK